MTNPEDNRSTIINTPTSNPVTAGGALSQSLPSSATTSGPAYVEPETTYVFHRNVTPTVTAGDRANSLLEPPRGHARSVSHGGGTSTAKSRPSALKSSIRGGHQRALSQGQITDNSITPPRSGHTRAGSKTDFILPPGHKDSPPRDIASGQSVTTSAMGHSRQASRSESIYTLRRADLPPWWKRLMFCRRSKFEECGYRLVVPNHTVPPKTPKRDHPNGSHCGNKIRTTKYTLLSFIPKNLLEQFHRVANLYFIFIVLLNWFPQINAFGKEIAMIPVLFVLGVTAIKDLFEDRRRRASDKRINNTTCRVYNGESERYRKVLWQDIRVGDVVHLSNNETVPADILLLRTSDPHGVCYIDTCDLDGETNLKRRQVVRGFAEKQIVFNPSKFVSKLEVDTPSTKIYRFHGAMVHPSGERVPVATESLLLRESRLKNTDFVEGICVYAGHETKAMLNNSGPRYKRSQLEQQMNIDVIWCVIILIILCVIGAVGCRMWLSSFTIQPIPFLPFEIDPNYEGLLSFWTYVIILQIMIPLSLYVTIELCKIFQVHLIHNNIELFDKQTNKRPECRAMNITEELGQVQYIFSDKTGTLTENKMIFRRCTINGVDYNHPKTAEEDILPLGSPALPLRPNLKLSEDLHCASITDRHNHKRIQDFFLVLALCNTVVVSATPHKDNMNASGVIEEQSLLDDSNVSSQSTLRNRVTLVKPTELNLSSTTTSANNTSSAPHSNHNNSSASDRYARLAESRSITPSPPPLTSISLKQPHIPSLSPISSSAESSPESTSPKMKVKSVATTPTERVRSIVSKLPCVPLILTNISNKKFAINVKRKMAGNTKLTSPLLQHRKPIYEAESPDELALVNAAYAYECVLVNRGPHHVLMSTINEGLNEYEILKVLPFDSCRKCMSIVVRRTGSQEIILYTKGADSSIMTALAPCPHFNTEEMRLRELTQQQLDLYARQGLRVLVMAKRNLKTAEFSDWFAKHQEAETTVENREKKVRDSYNALEQNLMLLGATGIEDRLQEGVPETIHSLLSAGIVIWVLTGDKTETAINVAYSAKLFHSQMEILKLTARSRDSAETSIMFYLSEIEKQMTGSGDCIRSQTKSRALVVDGKTLTFILDLRSNLTKPFLRLTKYCSSVLCCRSTPLQKAFLVKVVKEELRMSTLAIGDGANDVSMIQMADVGVGVCGQEGTQAVMASDFSLAKFKILERLLLVHGHWNYDRLSRMITYFFYKNAAFVFLLFWYQLYCGFSGSVMIDEVYLMIYNFVFTSLPPLAIGVYDIKIPEDLLLNVPRLYRHGRLSKAYKPHTFWIVMLDSLYQSLVIFFIAEAAYSDSDIGIWEFGTVITSSCLITMSIHCAIEIRSWTILHVMSLLISLGSFYVFAFFYNSVCVSCMNLPSSYWVIHMVMKDPRYYLIIVLTPVLALLPRLLFRVVENTMFPSDAMKIVIQKKLHQRRGENLLVASWSRSTSASSIYRTTDYGNKNKIVTTIG